MPTLAEFNAEIAPANGGGSSWSPYGSGTKVICWLLYLILLELRKTK